MKKKGIMLNGEKCSLKKRYDEKRDKKLKLSLIVPCYNEENNVKVFYDRCKSAFAGKVDSYEVIFINDGSKDGTRHKLDELFSESENVSVIDLSRNFGKEAAMLAGLEKACGEYVTVIDADLQQQPETVLEMTKILDENPQFDCVAAYQKVRHEGVFKGLCKSMFYKIINKMGEAKLHPAASDFRTMRRRVAEAVISLPEYHRFSKGIFAWIGFETCYIPYVAEKRHSGESSWSFKKLLHYSVDGITNYSVSPLRLPLHLGAVCVLVSLVYLAVKLFSGSLLPLTNGVLLGIILLLFGILSVFIGALGIYISKDYI